MPLTLSIKLRFLQSNFHLHIFINNLHWEHRVFTNSALQTRYGRTTLSSYISKTFHAGAKTNIIRSIIMSLSEYFLCFLQLLAPHTEMAFLPHQFHNDPVNAIQQ